MFLTLKMRYDLCKSCKNNQNQNLNAQNFTTPVLFTHKRTKSYRKTPKLLKLSKSTVERNIKPIKIDTPQHKMGQPIIISERDGRLILRT